MLASPHYGFPSISSRFLCKGGQETKGPMGNWEASINLHIVHLQELRFYEIKKKHKQKFKVYSPQPILEIKCISSCST